jgi:hypothetical protein
MSRHRHAARILTIISIVCVGVSAGCAGNLTRPTPLALGESFELHAGASAILQGGLTIAFNRVESDSRCPMDALCVWAGDATVTVSLSKAAESRVQRELHTDPRASETSYLAYSIKLVALAPHPQSSRPIRPQDYVATLTVLQR